MEIAETSGGGADSGTAELRAANTRAQAFYRAALAGAEGAAARRYLAAARGLRDAALERFEIGYASDSWDALLRALRAAGIPPEVGERAGLVAPRRSGTGYYDRLRDRITFPIRDEARPHRGLWRPRAAAGSRAQVPEYARDGHLPQARSPVRSPRSLPGGAPRWAFGNRRGLLRSHRGRRGGRARDRRDLRHGAVRGPRTSPAAILPRNRVTLRR